MKTIAPVVIVLFLSLRVAVGAIIIDVPEAVYGMVNRPLPVYPAMGIEPVKIVVDGGVDFALEAYDTYGKKIPWTARSVDSPDNVFWFSYAHGYYKIVVVQENSEKASFHLGVIPPPHPGLRKRSFFCSNTSHIRIDEELELLYRIGMRVQRVHISSEGESRTVNSSILDILKAKDNWILPIVGYSLGEKSEWAKKYSQHGPPADYSYFVTEWEKIVRDFHEVDVYEFWNEPWIFGWSWADTPFRYRELQVLWCNMARKVNPEIEVIVGNSWMFTMDHIEPYSYSWKNGLVHGTSHHPYIDNGALNWRSGAYQRALDGGALLNKDMGLQYYYISEGGTCIASPRFDPLKLSNFETPNNILNAAKVPQLLTYTALSGAYQSNMQWEIGYGPDWTMSNTTFSVYSHFIEDRPVIADIWPDNSLITGAIFANPRHITPEISGLPRANEINARWDVEIPADRADDETKVAVIWGLTGKSNFELDPAGQLTIENAKGIEAYDMNAVPIPPVNGKLTLPLNQYPVYLLSDKLPALELYNRIRSGEIHEITPVNISFSSLAGKPDVKQELHFRVDNHYNREVDILVSLRAEGKRKSVDQRYTLKEVGLSDLYIEWPGVKERNDNMYPVEATITVFSGNSQIATFTQKQVLQRATFFKRSITVDGNSSDWEGIVPVTLKASSGIDASKFLLNPHLKVSDSDKPETANARLYAAWDDEYLYFCLKDWPHKTIVGTDAKPDLELWKAGEPDGLKYVADCGDVLQIAFGFRERVPGWGRQMNDPWTWKGFYYDTDYQYAIYKDTHGKDHVMRQWDDSSGRQTAYQIDLVDFVQQPEGVMVKITDDCYEFAIPRGEIKLFNPEDEKFRFSFVLNGKFNWGETSGVFDYWMNNGSFGPSWKAQLPCQTFFTIEK